MYSIFTNRQNEIICKPPAQFLPNWHICTFRTILSLMCMFDFDPIIKFIVLYVGYPVNFLQVCTDISYRD